MIVIGVLIGVLLGVGIRRRVRINWPARKTPRFVFDPKDKEETRRLWEAWQHLSANSHFTRAFEELWEDVFTADVPHGQEARDAGRKEVMLTILKRIRTAERLNSGRKELAPGKVSK